MYLCDVFVNEFTKIFKHTSLKIKLLSKILDNFSFIIHVLCIGVVTINTAAYCPGLLFCKFFR